VKNQRQPTFTSAVMEAIAGGSKGREQMLFVLLGATGMRIGEALGLELEKHISSDYSTLHIRQKVWRVQIQLPACCLVRRTVFHYYNRIS
jgi:integrase